MLVFPSIGPLICQFINNYFQITYKRMDAVSLLVKRKMEVLNIKSTHQTYIELPDLSSGTLYYVDLETYIEGTGFQPLGSVAASTESGTHIHFCLT